VRKEKYNHRQKKKRRKGKGTHQEDNPLDLLGPKVRIKKQRLRGRPQPLYYSWGIATDRPALQRANLLLRGRRKPQKDKRTTKATSRTTLRPPRKRLTQEMREEGKAQKIASEKSLRKMQARLDREKKKKGKGEEKEGD